jgi:hypothetical protein
MPFPERSTQSKGLRGLFIDRKLNLRFHALPQLALQECSFPFKAGSFLPSTVQSPDPQTGHTTLSCPASLDLPLSHVNSMQNCCSCNSPSCGPCHQQLVKNAGVHLAGRSPSSNLIVFHAIPKVLALQFMIHNTAWVGSMQNWDIGQVSRHDRSL